MYIVTRYIDVLLVIPQHIMVVPKLPFVDAVSEVINDAHSVKPPFAKVFEPFKYDAPTMI